MRQLYISVMLPKITYSLDTWYTSPSKQEDHHKNTGSIATLRNLQKTQCIAMLAITGMLRTSPNDLVDIHANLFPIDLALTKSCHNAIMCYHTLPHTHPLHPILSEHKNNPRPPHPSPLLKLIMLFQTSNITLEIITPIITLNPTITRLITNIAKTREQSIELEKKDNADYKLFADGSCFNNGIGAATIMYKNNRIRPLKTLQYYLGPPTDHNTYEAEACSALLALWILENTPETIGKKMSLYLDNQVVIKAIKSNNANSGQQLIQHIKMALVVIYHFR